MKKQIIPIVCTLLTIPLLLLPFFLPESWIYIKHNEPSIIHPFAETWMSISIFFYGLFAGHGIYRFFESIFED